MSTAAAVLPSSRGAANARNIGSLVTRLWDVHVTAGHQVPRRGAVLVAANHTALLDGPFLLALAPRPLHLLAKSELFVGPVGRMLTAAGQVPLDYEGPDRSALLRCRALLADGQAVGIFPEAHRGRGDVAHAHHGAAYLALHSGATVVPAALLGTRRSGVSYDSVPTPRTRIDLVFGAPVTLTVDGDPNRRSVVARAGEQIRQHLADHVREACRRTGQRLPDPPAPRAES